MSARDRIKRGIAKIRDRFKDEVEEYALENAIYSHDQPKISNVNEFLSKYSLKPLGAGLNSRVFKIEGTKWLVKEARWDLDISLFKFAKIPIPRSFLQKLTGLFSFNFVPSEKNTMQDYKSYLEFAQYFGSFKKENDFPHPNTEIMIRAQQNIRDTLLFFKPALERKYKIKFDKKIDNILTDKDISTHNFLPKEFQLMGPAISKENKKQVTSYIFQEFIEGKTLAEVPDDKLSNRQRKQLVLMIYLILLMNMQIGIIPDTKPRQIMLNAHNWLTNTDNIMVTKNDLIFIDTRWFWDSNSNFIERGTLVPDLVINRAKTSIQDLLKQL